MIKILFHFFPIFFLTGCGYSILGGNPLLPKEAKSIGIYPVENHTFVAGLDTRTSSEIKLKLETNSSVEILPVNRSDLQLSISLNEIKSKTTSLDSIENVAGVIFLLEGSASLNERSNGNTIWKEPNLEVQMLESSSNNLVSNSLELSDENLDELSRLLAEKIYQRIFLEF